MLLRDPDDTEKQKAGGKGSVVLVSGGMDSAVTAAMAIRESPRIAFLHVRYGARIPARENPRRRRAQLSQRPHARVPSL